MYTLIEISLHKNAYIVHEMTKKLVNKHIIYHS